MVDCLPSDRQGVSHLHPEILGAATLSAEDAAAENWMGSTGLIFQCVG